MKMKSRDTGAVFDVVEHIILKNWWEYYVIDDPSNTDDIKLCFVMGFEDEMGDVSMDEIKPHILSRTKRLNQVAPAAGFVWVT